MDVERGEKKENLGERTSSLRMGIIRKKWRLKMENQQLATRKT